MSGTISRFRRRNPWRRTDKGLVCQATAHEWGLYTVHPWPYERVRTLLNNAITILCQTQKDTDRLDAFGTMRDLLNHIQVYFDDDTNLDATLDYLKINYYRKHQL